MADCETPPCVRLYTDGACKKNPGGLGGWGYILLYNDSKRERYGGDPSTTNNRMELTAVIEGLLALRSPADISIYTDSQYVIRGATEWMTGWLRRNWKTGEGQDVKNRDLWEELADVAGPHEITWEWVKGHNGDFWNERADVLANLGCQTIKG